MSDHKDVLRAREAQAVLDSAAFQAAMASLKTSVQQQWKECPIRDREGQVLLLQLTRPLAPQVARLSLRFQAAMLRLRGIPAIPKTSAPLPERAARKTAHTWGAETRSWATS